MRFEIEYDLKIMQIQHEVNVVVYLDYSEWFDVGVESVLDAVFHLEAVDEDIVPYVHNCANQGLQL
jgi:hypothetical protein